METFVNIVGKLFLVLGFGAVVGGRLMLLAGQVALIVAAGIIAARKLRSMACVERKKFLFKCYYAAYIFMSTMLYAAIAWVFMEWTFHIPPRTMAYIYALSVPVYATLIMMSATQAIEGTYMAKFYSVQPKEMAITDYKRRVSWGLVLSAVSLVAMFMSFMGILGEGSKSFWLVVFFICTALAMATVSLASWKCQD